MVCALGVAVLLRLDDLGVDAERDVVDEDPAVDGGEVDAALDGVAEGVERADDVVAVEAEVEREVVAGAGRDADERHVGRHGDRRHQGLGAVAAGHADHVGAAVDGVLGQLRAGRRRGCSTIGSMPRLRASSSRWNCSAFPPPDFRFMISRAAGRRPDRGAGVSPRACRVVRSREGVAAEGRRSGQQGEDDDHQEPMTLGGENGDEKQGERRRGARRAAAAALVPRRVVAPHQGDHQHDGDAGEQRARRHHAGR